MEPRATVDFALESIQGGDLSSAISRVESDDAVEQVSADYTQLIKILYGEHKDVTNMAAVGAGRGQLSSEAIGAGARRRCGRQAQDRSQEDGLQRGRQLLAGLGR